MSTPRPNPPRTPQGRLSSGVVFLLFALIALFFLFTEHRAHVLGAIPYLLLLACPLLHMFHGHSHRGHHASHREGGTRPPDAGPREPHSH